MERILIGSEPVTVDEAKEHIQGLEEITLYDAYIESLITACREIAENYIWGCITKSTFKLRLKSFPNDIKIPKPPLVSVTSITYVDENNHDASLDSSDYEVINWQEPGKIIFKNRPTTNEKEGNIIIEFVAGYNVVPASIKQAILMMIRTLFDNREDMNNRNITELPITSKHLLKAYRCYEF